MVYQWFGLKTTRTIC
jgi:hypothetical protein